VLGFPIRTPSDHSSVDSSPRLIAASYVLHRLLVPRHPPCALINLPQRCSRPLCSSQSTGNTHPETPAHPQTPKTEEPGPFGADKHQTTRNNKPTQPVCSLRTQQCAYPHPRTTDHVPPNPKTGVLIAEARIQGNQLAFHPRATPTEHSPVQRHAWTNPQPGTTPTTTQPSAP